MYLTYEEYAEMGGTLEVADFNNLEREARMLIDDITFKRLVGDTEYPIEVKECMYEVIGYLNAANTAITSSVEGENGAPPQIKSQSNDGVSISYNVVDAADVITQSRLDAKRAIQRCLFKVRNQKGHRLTYRGIYPDE